MRLYFMLCVFISVSSLLSRATIVSLLSNLGHNIDTIFFMEDTSFESVNFTVFHESIKLDIKCLAVFRCGFSVSFY
ncbi:hypothetical protein LSH36_15g02010 [Paralvinella palmiformis]|uniref:Uncharacterized protein n=1 Tax=Paralvinella palmiformis TaxID=53620 RepID=A0AAD9KCF0_9ANNE|nr:hypothetical protein LSH36_15g02010 [Paralvinella palmiformis]